MALFGTAAQQSQRPTPPGTADNLYEARRDGAIENDEPQYVRRQSLWLEAQMRPLAATAIIAALAAVTATGVAAARRRP